MAFAFVDSIDGGDFNDPFTTSPGIDTTGANLLVASIFFYTGNAATATVSDNKSNTWNPLTQQDISGNRACQLWYADNTPTVGSGHTFTVTGNGSFPMIIVYAFSGALASAFDQESGAIEDSGSATTLQPGSLTPAAANSLLVTAFGMRDDGDGQSISAGFTPNGNLTLANVGSLSMAYDIQTSAAASNPTWTSPNASRMIAVMASFLAAGGGGSGNPWYAYAQQ